MSGELLSEYIRRSFFGGATRERIIERVRELEVHAEEHEAALAAARQVDRKTVVRIIWDALESTDDWGSINDVQDLADTLLAALKETP